VTWSINDLETWNLQVNVNSALASFLMFLKSRFWEIGSTDLLGDSSSLTGLHISASELIKDKCFASIDVTQNTDNRASQFLLHVLLSLKSVLLCLFSFVSLCLDLSKSLLLSHDLLLSL
jgi:hypothetical protein